MTTATIAETDVTLAMRDIADAPTDQQAFSLFAVFSMSHHYCKLPVNETFLRMDRRLGTSDIAREPYLQWTRRCYHHPSSKYDRPGLYHTACAS